MTMKDIEEGPFEFVYGIHEGSIHTGGGMGSEVYKDVRVALELAEGIVEKNQKEQDEVYDDTESFITGFPRDWEKVGSGRWTNGIEEVHVIELRVK